jgi:hypothetical protein
MGQQSLPHRGRLGEMVREQASVLCSTEEEVPDSFFEFGMEDYAAIMQGYSQSKTRAEAGLRTAKLRQQEEAQKASKFPQTTIRIVFPDSYILQVTPVPRPHCNARLTPPIRIIMPDLRPPRLPICIVTPDLRPPPRNPHCNARLTPAASQSAL